MKQKFLTVLLALILVLVIPPSASAEYRLWFSENPKLERVPLRNNAPCYSETYKRFSDVSEHYWGKDGISYVVDKGLFNGTGDGSFSPELPTTRAMLCTVLYRFAGSPATYGSIGYDDVRSGEWYSDAVRWAKQNSILVPWVQIAPKFEPESTVTRGEFALMLRIFYEQTSGDKYNDGMAGIAIKFPDLPKNSYEIVWAFSWLYTYSILNGTSEHTMEPDALVTRSQLAAMLERYDRQFGTETANAENAKEQTPTVSVEAEPVKQELPPQETQKSTPDESELLKQWESYLPTEEEFKDELIRLINDYRAENGLPRLTKNEKLTEAADVRAKEASISFSHVRPNGEHMSVLGAEFGAENLTASHENLYAGAYSAKSAFRAWQNSPGHNAAMLTSSGATEIAIGICTQNIPIILTNSAGEKTVAGYSTQAYAALLIGYYF